MKRIFCLLIITAMCILVVAEKYDDFSVFGRGELTSSFVRCLYSDGYRLFIGTDRGLNIKDGTKFLQKYADYPVFEPNSVKMVKGNSFLVNNMVNDIERIGEKYYVATDGGISVYKYESDIGTNFYKNNLLILDTNYINALAKLGDRLFVGTADKGLFTWDTSGDTWRHVNKDTEKGSMGKFDALSVNCIKVNEEDGLVIVGSKYKGLYIYKDGTWRNINKKLGMSMLPSDEILSLEFQGDKLWIGTNKGLVLLVSGRRFKLYKEKNGIKYPVILSLKNINGKIYFGTGRGLYYIDEDENPQMVPDTEEYRILDIELHDDMIWLATQNNGLISL
ncbi:MAG: hypothetical protein C0601_06055 [Candidatus Muiribacterium halophilum]|uniref:Uncharacterized protein n=1 Tax=Muiribacterium halophilum TaxID=2053465 RepID=A0A2N5ZH14_MUIH1|nr:MAG: hypothetical protein C0601_06055 [Candidatus Muirbacterium halophilum]